MSHKIAIIGAANHVGRELLAVIEERRVGLDTLYAVELTAQPGQEVSYGEDSALPVVKLDGFDFSKVTVVINLAGLKVAKEIAMKVKAAGAVFIDGSSAFRMDPDVPLIVSDVNGKDVATHKGVIAMPHPAVVGLAAALAPLHAKAQINRIHATIMQSVSAVGQRAMDELFNQTRAIFMANPIENTEFPKQMAFNLIPQTAPFMDDRGTEDEFQIKGETKKILKGKMGITISSVRVPVFVGHSAMVHIDCDKEISAVEAIEALRQTRGIAVIELENEELEFMTPEEINGEDDVYVSRIREDSAGENGLCLWVCFDNIHKGVALNLVNVLEKL
jgi:aspartate-semialdehyde dehydrogenase